MAKDKTNTLPTQSEMTADMTGAEANTTDTTAATAGTPADELPTAAPADTTATATKESKPRVAPVLAAVRSDVPMPTMTASARGSKSLYPFDSLTEVGQSFAVANKAASSLASIVSNQNREGMVQKKDAQGNTVFKTTEAKDPQGNVMRVPTLEPEMVAGKTFVVKDVNPETDPDKATCRVWRTA